MIAAAALRDVVEDRGQVRELRLRREFIDGPILGEPSQLRPVAEPRKLAGSFERTGQGVGARCWQAGTISRWPACNG